VIKVCFVHSQGCFCRISCAKLPEYWTSRGSISRALRTNALVDHRWFPLREAIDLSTSTRRTLAVCYTVHWRPLTTVWRYLHPTAYCFFFVLLPVWRKIFKCASWVLYLVAVSAASWWTNWCLRYCCLPISDIFDAAPAHWSDLDRLGPGGGGFVSMMCWCGIGEEDDDEKMGEALRMI